jgi:hypothetical protein
MGKNLVKKANDVLGNVLATLAEFGKGASYALRN